MTTAIRALGLTPMLFATDTEAQFLIPMAVSLPTGILFASVMILFRRAGLNDDRGGASGDKQAGGNKTHGGGNVSPLAAATRYLPGIDTDLGSSCVGHGVTRRDDHMYELSFWLRNALGELRAERR